MKKAEQFKTLNEKEVKFKLQMLKSYELIEQNLDLDKLFG